MTDPRTVTVSAEPGLQEALAWALHRLAKDGYSHDAKCSPNECRCGFWQACAALASRDAAPEDHDHDHHYDPDCVTCTFLAGKSPASRDAATTTGDPMGTTYPLTGADILRAIEATRALINPRLSEVDWDDVSAILSGLTVVLADIDRQEARCLKPHFSSGPYEGREEIEAWNGGVASLARQLRLALKGVPT